MASISEVRALPSFDDTYGRPLEGGSIYIGQPNLDPKAYPQVAYSSLTTSIALQQPIRTTHGRAVSGGAAIHIFTQIPFSIAVYDQSGRAVYISLYETDSTLQLNSTTTIQSLSSLDDLRARSGAQTNQVFVEGYGLYIADPTDITSPEALPWTIVGSDGTRYKLAEQNLDILAARVTSRADPVSAGMYIGWNDASGTQAGYFSTNSNSTGGFVWRVVNAANTAETGRAQLSSTGELETSSDVQAGAKVRSLGGAFSFLPDDSRELQYDGSNYLLPSADLYVNGGKALTSSTYQATILANQQANGIGAVALGTNAGPNPTLPGTWVATGSASNSVYLWTRTA